RSAPWSHFLVAPPALRACQHAMRIRRSQTMPVSTHPAFLDGRHTQHKCIVRNVPSHHCSRANKGIPPNRRATDDGGIGANGRPASHQGARILIVTHDLRTWVDDVSKNKAR